MTTIARRIAAGIVLTAAPPTMIALGVAGSADAQTGFPYQGGNAPQPGGTSVHHHHQNHR